MDWRTRTRFASSTGIHLLRSELVSEIARPLEIGADLPESLNISASEHPSRLLRGAMSELGRRLSGGMELSRALEAMGRLAGREAPALARVGERSGRMPEAIHHLEEVLERTARQARVVRNAWLQPGIVLLTAWIVLLVLCVWTFPAIFRFTDRPVPGLLAPFTALRAHPWMFGLLALGLPLVAATGWRLLSWTERGERWLRAVPRWGALREAGRLALFCRSLGLLVGSGVPLDEAMAIIAEALPAGAVRRSVREAGLRLAAGEPVAEVFRRPPFFSPLVRIALEWPQEAGGVAPGFARIADFYEAELLRLGREMDVAAEVAAILTASAVAGVVVILAWGGYFSSFSHMAW